MKTNQQIKCEITVAKYKKRRGKKNWWLFSSERMWTTQFEAMGIVPSFKLLFFFFFPTVLVLILLSFLYLKTKSNAAHVTHLDKPVSTRFPYRAWLPLFLA